MRNLPQTLVMLVAKHTMVRQQVTSPQGGLATSKLATERHLATTKLATKGYLTTSDFADRTIIEKDIRHFHFEVICAA